jgi:starch phosphorylase
MPKSGGSLLEGLTEIAANVWWSWHPEVAELFRAIDAETFAKVAGNPFAMLRRIRARRQRELLADRGFMARLGETRSSLRRYLRERPWYRQKHPFGSRGVTAYFCMEYALHESLPLYAGGLGVLAGDHLKSASDLGLPLVAVGLCWRNGYTRQQIDHKGRQQDLFPRLEFRDVPFEEVRTANGRPLRIRVEMAGENVHARARLVQVGRVRLYLLDTALADNSPKHRRIARVLYSGDRDARVRQEILLGIGGWRLLRKLDIPVSACHLNEGHAAFLSLERIAERIRDTGETFSKALKYVRDTTIFTTHTPVPAGNEEFDPALVDRYLGGYAAKMGLTREAFHDLARVKPGRTEEAFGMTPLALRTARHANGVAALHGRIARGMWKPLYPKLKLAEVPIGHVTNGVHIRTWLHSRMKELLDAYLPAGWEHRQDRAATWAGVRQIDDGEFWQLHQSLKQELIVFCRERLRAQFKRVRTPGMKLADIDRILDPGALTIGFARRFASYKRASLIFTDPDRLARILNDRRRPVQLIFSGKAHPADTDGKALVETIVRFSRMPRFRRRVVFLEDYEMHVARHLVAGCDVWLNNPERPREASGTSGMKPPLHGGLNLSILDGWWPEGYNRRNGWAIGRGRNHEGKATDRRDAEDIYRLLVGQVVPLYYDRDANGVPRRWVDRMKNALLTIPPVFNSHRQVKEYLKRYYLPAMRRA